MEVENKPMQAAIEDVFLQSKNRQYMEQVTSNSCGGC